jgi:hypothetical protein
MFCISAAGRMTGSPADGFNMPGVPRLALIAVNFQGALKAKKVIRKRAT